MESSIYPSLQPLLLKADLSECRYGGKCYNMSSKHSATYRHPDFCPHNGYCRNMGNDHLFAYRHAPLCKYALQCRKKEISDHAIQYRHCNRTCSHGSFCVKFHDPFHIDTLSHPFLTPCPLTPYNCSQHDELIRNFSYIHNEILAHCHWFAHVCHWGRQCPLTNEEHIQTTTHVARNFCPWGNQCVSLLDEDHLNSYSHPGILDIRQPCSYGVNCSQKQNQTHVILYRHEDTYHFSIAPYFGFHENSNYVKNQCEMFARIEQYMISKEYQRIIVPDEIMNFVRVLQPMHRCKRNVFESILCQGHLMSLYYMDLLKEAKRVADQVWTQVEKTVEAYKNPRLQQTIQEFILTLVQNEFNIVEKQLTNDLNDAACDTIQFHENILGNSSLNKEHLDIIRQRSIEVAKASLHLYNNRPGIHHGADKYFGTDKHVFGILGPNLGHRYGDIMILFKRQIMLHPDANFAIQAATTFGESGNAYKWRPWLSDPGKLELRIAQFPLNVLHCSVPSYEFVAAAELMAVTAKELNIKDPNDISLEQVIKRWMKANPHQRFETHLPALIPLDYIDHVYMPKSVFESLSPLTQKTANEVLGSLLTITPHEVPSDDCINEKMDDMRATYQKFVLDEVVERFVQMARNVHNPEIDRTRQGFVITLPASKLEAHVVIPMRISQLHMQLIDNNPQTAFHPSTFIYWQALGGDMMVILSNEPIRTAEKQSKLSTLTCYIADPASVFIPEGYSYISGAPFYSHYTTQNPQNLCEVSSNTFHRGCNSQGYFTYCLQIESSVGQVTLSHAGPDIIYNHQKLTYQFTKHDLDLSNLDCVQLSAGKKAVPIRSFIITNERISQLHPSFEKNFKREGNICA